MVDAGSLQEWVMRDAVPCDEISASAARKTHTRLRHEWVPLLIDGEPIPTEDDAGQGIMGVCARCPAVNGWLGYTTSHAKTV